MPTIEEFKQGALVRKEAIAAINAAFDPLRLMQGYLSELEPTIFEGLVASNEEEFAAALAKAQPTLQKIIGGAEVFKATLSGLAALTDQLVPVAESLVVEEPESPEE
jgi:hypothetical protein